MLTVMLDAECEALLLQTAADLEMSPSEVGQVLLESALLMSLSR